jgi:catechol 2,3-dioxygenase-like lactoylglutathione lyase family enzyme
MFTRIDHIMICVPDLQQGIEAYTKLGFSVRPGGLHPGKGTHNAIAFFQDDYLELLAIRDMAEHQAAAPGSPDAGLTEFLAAGGGLRYVVVQGDDLAADVAAMRARGVDVSDAVEGGRRTAEGQDLRWKGAVLGPQNPLPIFFIQHLTPIEERRRQAPAAGHPNGVQRLDRVYLVTDDLPAQAQAFARVLDMPVPAIRKGTVIMADMAVFDLGPTGLTVAQPYAPGPAAEALARRGPGPFQALYRTSSMAAAASWMAGHGLPPPVRGVRNTGEQAMLATPEHACGVYIGFVGPE